MILEPPIVLAYHEAGHAVTAEALVPGSVDLAVIYPWKFGVERRTRDTVACVNFTASDCFTWVEFVVVTYAGKWADNLFGHPDETRLSGDMSDVQRALSSGWVNKYQLGALSKKSKRTVKKNKDVIERLANVLSCEMLLTGDQVRSIIMDV